METPVPIILSVCLILSVVCSKTAFSQTNGTVSLAHETSWAPQYGKELRGGGYTVAIAREALRRAGYGLEPVWLPWKRALEETAAGKHDGLGACYYTLERDEKYAYTKPFAKTETVFVKLKSRNIAYDDLRELSSYVIGTTIGYGYPDNFLQANYLKKEEARSIELNVRKLLRGRIDLVIAARKVLITLLNNKFPSQLHLIDMVEKSVGSQKLYVAFSRKTEDYAQKVTDFNTGLESMMVDGTIDRILQDYGFH